MPFARICLLEHGDPEAESLTILAFLGSDNIAIERGPYAGWRGRPGDEWCWPVVFLSGGMVDHGGDGDCDTRERYSHMEIYERPFTVGQKFVMKHYNGNPSTHFIVHKVELVDDQD